MTFALGYYVALIASSCAAAFYEKRSLFMMLFSLTLISFVVGIVGGEGALRFIATSAGLLALAAGVSYAFKEFLVQISRPSLAKELRDRKSVV